MYRGQAISVLKQHPNAQVVVTTRDGTGRLWADHLVSLDDDGELVMTHPTDPGRPPIRAPESGRYRVLSEDPDWAALRLAPGSKVRVLCRPVANDNAWSDRELYLEQVRWWGVAAK